MFRTLVITFVNFKNWFVCFIFFRRSNSEDWNLASLFKILKVVFSPILRRSILLQLWWEDQKFKIVSIFGKNLKPQIRSVDQKYFKVKITSDLVINGNLVTDHRRVQKIESFDLLKKSIFLIWSSDRFGVLKFDLQTPTHFPDDFELFCEVSLKLPFENCPKYWQVEISPLTWLDMLKFVHAFVRQELILNAQISQNIPGLFSQPHLSLGIYNSNHNCLNNNESLYFLCLFNTLGFHPKICIFFFQSKHFVGHLMQQPASLSLLI